MNLITNAYHAIDSNRGRLYVFLKETDEKPFRETSPSFDNSQQRFALIEVRDTGIGIALYIIDKIFDPYFTTKEKGTWLGLATVYGIVKKFDGEIRVFSKIGKSTRFKIYSPLIGQEDEIQIFERPNKDFTGDERILIVDDEGAIAKLEQIMLERSGYRVTRRTSSIDALEKIKESPYQFDLVVADMVMPKLSGDAQYTKDQIQKTFLLN